MTAKMLSFPSLSQHLLEFCAAHEDAYVSSAPQWILDFIGLAGTLPERHAWSLSDVNAFKRQLANVRSSIEFNRLFWNDQAGNIDAYAIISAWRGVELLNAAIRALNIGDLLAPAVLARSLLELSASYVLHANTIEKQFNQISFPKNQIITSREFEEYVVKMIWGTRLGDPEQHYKQTNVLTFIQKLAKNQNASALLQNYEFLCEIAHPNVIGNIRFWSHVKRIDDLGMQTIELSRVAENEQVSEIKSKVIWSLGWSAALMQNSHFMIGKAVGVLRGKLNEA